MSVYVKEDLSQCAGVGDLLSGSWELTLRIFENLSFREVARLRAVCKLWADVGAKILERRRKLHYLTVHPHNVSTTEGKVIISNTPPVTLFEKFFEYIVSKPRYCIGFCNEDWIHKGEVFTRDREKGVYSIANFVSLDTYKVVGPIEHHRDVLLTVCKTCTA
ncbi:uncharacterized protein [Palaemon carinicauda]|uniref:uncharacterized protein n=1 Tax=Palaemon carinicauda TaxID=392227 RepID=UPI0035B6185B